MALDTTLGGAASESYITVASADTYHTNRGVTAWAATTAAKEAALRKATDYLTQTYRGSWKGARVDSVQVLDWPRSGIVVDGYEVLSTSIPAAVQNACAELAYKSISGELLADQEQGVVSETIGPITTVYDRNSPQAKKYPAVARLLAPLLSGRSGISVRLER